MSQSIPIAAATNMLSSIRAKEESYKQGIQKNHAFCKSIASRLMKDTTNNNNNHQHIGTIEEVLLKANQDCNDNNNNDVDIGKTEKIQEFLQEQRERLKVLAKHNIEDDRTVSLFCTSLTSLQQYMITNDNSTTNDTTTTTNNNTTTPLTDYQIVFEKIMADEQQKQQPNLIDIQYELMYRDICESLGEPVQTKTTNNANGINDDDDDDLVCVGNNNSTISLKCPITGMLFDDPVKNKACHHTYSRAGIMNHIQVQQRNHTSNNHTVRCPVPGCSNNKVTIDQLDIDYEMELKLRHVRRRQQDDTTTTTNNNGTTTTTTNNSQNASQKNVNTIIDDDDDDDDENQAQF